MSRLFGLGVKGRGVKIGNLQVVGEPVPMVPTTTTNPTPTSPGTEPTRPGLIGATLDTSRTGGALTRADGTLISDSAIIKNNPGLKTGIFNPTEARNVIDVLRHGSTSPIDTLLYRSYGTDQLDVSVLNINNETFQPVEKDGISSYRPEVISVFDFSPAFNGPELTPAGSLLDFQYQSLRLREQSLYYLFEQLESSPNGAQNLSRMKEAFASRLENVKSSLGIFENVLRDIDTIKSALNIKEYPSAVYNTSKFKTWKDFFTSEMQFPIENYRQFSRTKILLQTVFDFRNILENYSYGLFDIRDEDRSNSYSPTSIDNTYTLSNDFSFNINSIRSETEPANATTPSFFNQFLSSLPESPDDRIKLLINLLSKEFRVSKGLGTTSIQNDLQRDFSQGNSGNPFDNILGSVNNNILEPVLGEGSLASVSKIEVNENVSVLPFESKYIDFEGTDKVFIPGGEYLAETIVDVSDPTLGFNIQPFVDFASTFSNISSKARSSIMRLLELDQRILSGLIPENVFDLFSSILKDAIKGTIKKDSLTTDQVALNALFKLANTDNTLKLMLFQFCILAALDASTEEEQRETIKFFVGDLRRNISNLSFVRLERGENSYILEGRIEYTEFLRRLASDIEERARNLLFVIPDIIRTSGGRIRKPQITLPELKVIPTNLRLNVPSVIAGLAGNGTIVNLPQGNLASILLEATSTVGGSTANLVKGFIDVYLALTRLGSDVNNPIYTVGDASNRTRFNFLSSTTLALLIFEVFSSFTEKYTFNSFSKTQNLTSFKIEVSAEMNEIVLSAIENIVQTKVANIPKITPLGMLPTSLTSKTTTMLDKIPKTLSSNILKISPGTSNTSAPGGTKNLQNFLNSTNIPANVIVDVLSSPKAGTTPLSISSFTDAIGAFQRIGATANFWKDFALKPELFRGMEYFISLKNVRRKLEKEQETVLNILHIFETVEKQLNSAVSRVRTNLTRNLLQEFLALDNQTEDLAMLRSRVQIRTARQIYDQYLNKLQAPSDASTSSRRRLTSDFVLFDAVGKDQYNALLSFLSQRELSNQKSKKKFRILTVGLPQNMTRQISDRIDGTAIGNDSFLEKEFDVISINVYKRDIRMEELVFKPKKYTFDLSLYPDTSSAIVRAGRGYDFERLLETMKLKDLSKNPDLTSINLRELSNLEEYSFMNFAEKRRMFSNHVQDFMLKTYCKTMSGIDLSEQTFTYADLSNLDNQVDENFLTVVLDYIRNTLRINLPSGAISDLLTNRSVDARVRDMLQLASFGNLLSRPRQVQELVISPKKFDRTFSILLDLEDFEVDTEATQSTESGRSLFEKEEFRKLIDQTALERDGVMKLSPTDDLRFEDYFVVVETRGNG